MLVVGVGFAMWWLTKLSFLLVVAVVLFAGLFAGAIWMLRYERPTMAAFYRRPACKYGIDFVCFVAREQPPTEVTRPHEDAQLMLRTEQEFGVAASRMRDFVRGHDALLDHLFRHLHGAVMLRERRVAAPTIEPPLGVFLLVGPEGVGKRYLARVLSRLLFRSGRTEVLEMDKLGADATAAVFGAKGSPGALVEAVRRQPYQVVVVEHIEAAPAPVARQLAAIFRTGVGTDLDTGRSISYRNCLFILTTTRSAAALSRLAAQAASSGAWLQQASNLLSSETSLDSTLLAPLTDVLCCHPPGDLVKAEVVTMLMVRECNTYGVALDYVDPEIVASEVSSLRDELGFAIAPDRVRKLLRNPLVAVAEQQRLRMSLKAIPQEIPVPS